MSVPYDTLASLVEGISASWELSIGYGLEAAIFKLAFINPSYLSSILRLPCLNIEFQAALDFVLSTFSSSARNLLHWLSI